MPNTMPTPRIEGLVWGVPGRECFGKSEAPYVHVTIFICKQKKQITTGINGGERETRDGGKRPQTDYESAALTIELRAQNLSISSLYSDVEATPVSAWKHAG